MAKTYTPVGWKDGEIITPAMANLTTGEVTPPEVEGGTLVCAENLNHMDNAIKDLYDGGASTTDIVISDEEPTVEDWKLWIDTGEVQNLGSEVVDTLDGNETTKAPSVQAVNNKFNEISTYSTEEKVIGTWDDGKTLYRKTVEGTVSKSNENVIIGTIPNIETVAKKYGQGLAGGLYWTDLDLKYSDTVSSIIQIGKADGQIIAVFSHTFLGWPFHLTIEYTKTTDSATNTINEEPINEEATI